MLIRHIYHSCFLVETEQSYYLFDYYKGELPPLAKDKPIVVLASHAHKDHYNPALFPLLRELGMERVFAVLANDIPKKKYPEGGVDALTVSCSREYSLPGGERLETLCSTDSGVAFLLAVEGGVLYHAGDLNDWAWNGASEADNRQMRGSYRHEIDKLAGRRIDAAFVPLDPRLEEHYGDGLLYFLEATEARRVYPMHYWGKHGVIRRFVKEHPQFAQRVASIKKEGEVL